MNKQQIRAVEYLTSDLDELSNKPRRLFSSFRRYAEAFIEDKENLKDILSDIDEWEEMYYHNINSSQLLEDCGRASRETRKELIKNIPEDWNEDKYHSYKYGVEQATKKMALIMTKNLIEELY